ncbi:MAG: hypothetical protein EXR53_06470 [Dehalococcoidia bacterium]|nr:hypothetical protein [Dehalococcoidia bacterium]
MATEEQIFRVITSLAEIKSCGRCGTRLRWGDFECPHCGADLDDQLRLWAQRVVDTINQASNQ